jgi:hypothetical protein
MMARSLLLALFFAVAAAAPNDVPSRTVSAMDEEGDTDVDLAIDENEWANGTDETERDDEDDLNSEMEGVEAYFSALVANTSSVSFRSQGPTHPDGSSSTPAPERGDAGKCVPACYRHGHLAHKPRVKCDRFICKACAECFGKPGSAICRNEYTSMITRVKNGHEDIPNCGGKADSIDKSGKKCRLPYGEAPNKNAAFDVCDLLGEGCAGILVSHTLDTVVLKGPYVEKDVKKGSIELKYMMCVK